ncbi:MAG: hypothetical protein ACRDHP_17810, partial [Ktedonobacterales bacterium]
MPVSPCPACPARSAAPSSPLSGRHRVFTWRHVIFAATVALASLAALMYTALFLFSHGLVSQASGSPQPIAAYSGPGGGVSPLASMIRFQACASGSRTVWGDSLTLSRSESVCGNVDVYGGDATIDGSVGGSVTVAGGSAIIHGDVTGDVTTLGGTIVLGANADVGGNVDALGGTVQKAPSARVGGNIEHGFTLHGVTPLSWLGFTGDFVLRWWSLLFWGLAGALAAIFCPRQL